MFAVTDRIQLRVPCPICSESYTVPLSAVEQSQHLLAAIGSCSGMESYECPLPYLSALVAPESIAELRHAASAFEDSALRKGVTPVLEGTETPQPPLEDAAEAVMEARERARALARWENEGGAPGPAL